MKARNTGLSNFFLCQNKEKCSNCYPNGTIISNPCYFQVSTLFPISAIHVFLCTRQQVSGRTSYTKIYINNTLLVTDKPKILTTAFALTHDQIAYPLSRGTSCKTDSGILEVCLFSCFPVPPTTTIISGITPFFHPGLPTCIAIAQLPQDSPLHY